MTILYQSPLIIVSYLVHLFITLFVSKNYSLYYIYVYCTQCLREKQKSIKFCVISKPKANAMVNYVLKTICVIDWSRNVKDTKLRLARLRSRPPS